MLPLRLLLLLYCCLVFFPHPASNQTAGHRGRGRGVERIKVLFTPTICKVRCTQGRCTNFCERGNVTTLYNSEQPSPGSGFRVFLCPMLCKNGGVCIQKDRCLCPPTFTGKFCHIPVTTSSTNDIEKPPASPVAANQQLLTQSEYILPLQSQQPHQASAPGSSMVKVRVQHPPEASVKIHQVLKVGFGPTLREHSETVTWSAGLSGSRTSMLPGERAEAAPPQVQAQTLRGDSTYTESSGFKYCFREVRNSQCSSPLPGLRSQETCCRGIGLAWGINECTLCPSNTHGNSANGCPKGFERINGTQCVDINECSQPSFCENGNCVNTRGSYSCVCRQGYLLDASHGICISQKVISEEKNQCFRILNQGSCALPILRNITKQICCCSRVGKAWGKRCEGCPYFGSAAFKEICPAGPGYHYSASAIKFNQRLVEQHGTGGPPLVSQRTPETRPQQPASGSLTPQIRPQSPPISGSLTPQTRPQQPSSTGSLTPQTRPQYPDGTASLFPNTRPQQPSSTGSLTPQTRPQYLDATDSLTPNARPQQPSIIRPGNSATAQPTRVLTQPRVCETRPQVCGAGHCVDQPGGRHTCVCNPGHQLNSQQTQCQDVNECLQSPRPCSVGQCENTPGSYRCVCPSGYQAISQQTLCQDIDECRQSPNPCNNGRCENTPGSHRCVCRTGYKLQGNTCIDIDECEDPLQCPGQECVNSQGSYRCVSCRPGFGLLNGQCSDIDECRQHPSPCTNGRCENIPGSYRCVCRTGYRLQGNTCADVNECEDPSQCPGQECVNSQGSYRCESCRQGFRLLNGQCTDVDECRQSPNPCTNGRCENTLGSYRCVCRTGFRLQGNTCADINECEDPSQCPGQECVNSQGSYRCESCRPGFRLLNRQCSDVDECRQSPNPCTNGRCENTLGSYRCVCRTGFRLQGNTCADINECEDPSQCPGQECVNSQGSYRCVSCRPGFRLLNGQCSDIDECSQTPRPCTNGHCENTLGSYRCVSCRPGFELLNGQCSDVDECRQIPAPCTNARCENSPGSFSCLCRPGFRLDGNTCTDVDECENALQCPGKECVNSHGSFKCVACKPGFGLQIGQCQDVDECRQIPNPCTNARCENSLGSYRCECLSGYRLQGNTCADIDECEDPWQCPGQQCVNSQGSYKCVPCKDGYSMQHGKCADMDECESPQTCGPESVCANTDGSFRCDCKPGYRLPGAGRHCRDINECLEGEYCFPRGECVNTDGSYRCVCSQGYKTSANGSSCLDVDECGRPGVCQDGRCVNTEGSFQCQCQTGFTTNPEKTACLDVDECVDSEGAVCWPQRCENTIGSYHCFTSCEPGYSITPTGECVDINECANETVCGEHAFCQNLIGTYQCMCDQGYEATGDGWGCVDENECESMQGVCGSARCENVEGSFLCECPVEGEEFDPRTGQCLSRPRLGRPAIPGGSSSSSSSSSTVLGPQPRPGAVPVALPPGRPGEQRECYYNTADRSTCSVLSRNTTQQECCCTVGQGWGSGCTAEPCPTAGTAEYQALCPSGRGYVTTRQGAFSYRDVDECKLFDSEVCKSGVCVNNIPGYSCYCSSGYYYDTVLLACIDNDECDGEDACPGGICINTVGSYYCFCEPPLVLDDTQRNCINSTGLAVDENLSFCWQHVTADLVCQSPLLGGQVTFTECCCLYGEAWGLQCALCPAIDSEDYEALCNVLRPPAFTPPFPDHYGPGPGPGQGGGYGLPYGPDSFPVPPPRRPEYPPTDYDDYSPIGTGVRRSDLRERPPSSYGRPDSPFSRPGLGPGSYYDEDDFEPRYAPSEPDPGPPFRILDPRGERAFRARPPPPIPEGLPLRLAPLPDNSPYDEDDEDPWRVPPPFPPFPERRGGGEVPRRVYERRYEPYEGLSTEECGILRGCENGRCIRVSEGYTCDCYEGYQLDMTSMACIDINECEEADVPDCINGQCINTEGSYRCVCLRGFVISRRPNYCVPA